MKQVIIFLIIVSITTKSFSQQNIFNDRDYKWADSVLRTLSLREKISQLFMLDLSADSSSYSKKYNIEKMIQEYGLGGVIIMKSNKIYAKSWIQDLQNISKVPLFVSIDAEWGLNMRIANTIKYPYALTLGAITDNNLLFKFGQSIGAECRSIGVNINFAPVVDVNTNPNNPVINYRSFGQSKFNVCQKALEVAIGMQSQGVMSCLKHFPGHGDTDIDSHKDLPTILKNEIELNDIELFPYKELVKKDIWSIMVGHLNVPALDNSGKPATISKNIVNGLLKQNLGYNGLIFTDALNMKGISKYYNKGDIELNAFLAGNDILLYSENMPLAIDKIEENVSQDFENFEELHKKVRKILLYKSKLINDTFNNYSLINTENSDKNTNYNLCQSLYDNSITYLYNKNNVLEKILDNTKTTRVVTVGDVKKSFLQSRLFLNNKFKIHSIDDLSWLETIDENENIIVIYNDLLQSRSKKFNLDNEKIRLINLFKSKKNVLNVWLGNPYGLEYFKDCESILVAYEENEFSYNSVYKVLNNEFTPKGILPIDFSFENLDSSKNISNGEKLFIDFNNAENESEEVKKK